MQLVHELSQIPGRHLVIVRYGTNPVVEHDTDHEFVHNAADIDNAKIVWARDMRAGNEQLIHYFRDRQLWLLKGDESAPQLSPYLFATHVVANSGTGQFFLAVKQQHVSLFASLGQRRL